MSNIIAIITSLIKAIFGLFKTKKATAPAVKAIDQRIAKAEEAVVDAYARLKAAQRKLENHRNSKKTAKSAGQRKLAEAEMVFDMTIVDYEAAEAALAEAETAYKAAVQRLASLRKQYLKMLARSKTLQKRCSGREELNSEASAKLLQAYEDLDSAKAALAHAKAQAGLWAGHALRRGDAVSVNAAEAWKQAVKAAEAKIKAITAKIANIESVLGLSTELAEQAAEADGDIFAIEAEISLAEEEVASTWHAVHAAGYNMDDAKRAMKAARAAWRRAQRELERLDVKDDVKLLRELSKAQLAYNNAIAALKVAEDEVAVEDVAVVSTSKVAQSGMALKNNTLKRVFALRKAEQELRKSNMMLAANPDSIMLQKRAKRAQEAVAKANDSLRRAGELYARLAERGEAARVVITTDSGVMETVWASSEEAAANAVAVFLDGQPDAQRAKITISVDGDTEVHFMYRFGISWAEDAKDNAPLRFAQSVVSYPLNAGYDAGSCGRTGLGNMPEWRVVLKYGKLVIRAESFSSRIQALNAFSDLNTACRHTAFTAQLFKKGSLERWTGDKQDIADTKTDDLATIVAARFEAFGIPANRVSMIMDFCYDGTVESLKRINSMLSCEYEVIPGIGRKTAELAEKAMEDFVLPVRQAQFVERPTSPMIPVRKYILQKDGTVEETVVNVKLSPLFRKVQELAAEKAKAAGTDAPAMLPLVVFEHQVKLGRKEKPEDSPAIEELRRKVRDNWQLGDGLFKAALHGTNAGKLCRTWWIREDLVDEAIRFCSADASAQARWTAAKRNAYLGLMGVGTTAVNLPIGGEHIAFIPNLDVEIVDDVVFVDGKKVDKVSRRVVRQKAFDGFAMIHISDKLEKKWINEAPNRAVRRAIEEALKDIRKHGFTLRFPGCKGLCVSDVDFHSAFHEWGKDTVIDMFGRELNIDDVCILADEGVFKFSIGQNGTHATYEEYCRKCREAGHMLGKLLTERKAHEAWLPTQQLQTMAGVPESVARSLAEVAADWFKASTTTDGVDRLLPGVESVLLKACPQIAAHWYFSERLQKAYTKNLDLVYAGKIPGSGTGHFVAPDPAAFVAWAAFRDVQKVKELSELDAYEVRVADTAGRANDGDKAVMSRNPSTDLGGQVEVTVYTKFSSDFEKFMLRKSSIVYTSIWDTSATRLRMDFDGDHVHLCYLLGVIDGVKEAAQAWYGLDRAPVIDWVPPTGNKTTLSDEDLKAYFEGLWQGSELGLRMDTLTKLYNSIPCGGQILDWHREAVAWLTYAVNVLVDASKHGSAAIEEPDSVKMANDLLMGRAVAYGKMRSGKQVDMSKVISKLGNGVVDTYARYAMNLVARQYKLEGCDYTKDFDPRAMMMPGTNDGRPAGDQMRDIRILNFATGAHWAYYAYARNEFGELTTELEDEPTLVAAYDDSIANVLKQDGIGLGSTVAIRDDDVGIDTVGVLVEGDGEVVLDPIPGKWIVRERYTTTDNKGRTHIYYSGFWGILQGRVAATEKAMREDDHALTDWYEARQFGACMARESVAAQASLFGYGEDDAINKLVLWLFSTRHKTDADGNVIDDIYKSTSRWNYEFFLRTYGYQVAMNLGVAQDVAIKYDPSAPLCEDDYSDGQIILEDDPFEDFE